MPRRLVPVPCWRALLALAAACGTAGEPLESHHPTVDSAAGPPAPVREERVVPLRTMALRIAPDPEAPPSLEIAAGTALRVVRDAGDWMELATWDDRRGWAPAEQLMELALWQHLRRALGGAVPHALRPAYPVGGRWAVEAPPYTEGVSLLSTVWLVGGVTRSAKVATIDTLADCGKQHRLAILSEEAPGPRESRPDLSRAVLAVPASARPAAVMLPVSKDRGIAPGIPGALAGGAPPRLLAAYATDGGGPPTLLLVEALDYGFSRLDLYVANADRSQLIRAGFEWGCQGQAPDARPSSAGKAEIDGGGDQ